MNKKAQYTISTLGALAIVIVTASIIIAVGGEILSDVGKEIKSEDSDTVADMACGANGTAAYNATCGGLEGVETFADWLDTIALIIVAAVVIGIIVSSFGRAGR